MIDPNTYKLLTPGPLTTSVSVRAAMQIDRCTWDEDYKRMTEDIRQRLLALAHAPSSDYTCVLMQGSGTFGVEAVLSSVPGQNDTVLVLVNGAYSDRMCRILSRHHIAYKRLETTWDAIPDAKDVCAFLKANPDITMVAMVHNETTSGLLNDIESVSRIVKNAGCSFIVDAMSSFGAIDIDMPALGIDFLISSANKCIQGVPGFSFILARQKHLMQAKKNARSLSLDLFDQWETMEKGRGKWRFTSPTHAVAAFHQALIELEEEGGPNARLARYRSNNNDLRQGMEKLGFKAYIDKDKQGPIITTFFYPNDTFDFADMYAYLKKHGYVIYPGKLTERDTFRLGNIGEIYSRDIENILSIFASYLKEKNYVSH